MGSPEPVADRDRSTVSLTLVAMVLALVAGFVDAVGYLHVINVFPANQSGNVAFLGLSIGGASPAPGWAPPVAITAFMVGARGRPLVVVAGRPAPKRGNAPRSGAGAGHGGRHHLSGRGRAPAIHNDGRAGRRARHRGGRDGRADRRHLLCGRCGGVDHLPVGRRRPHRGDHRHTAGQPRAQVRATAVGGLVAGAGCVRGRGRARREPTRRRPHWLPRAGGAGRADCSPSRVRDPGRDHRHPRWVPGATRSRRGSRQREGVVARRGASSGTEGAASR